MAEQERRSQQLVSWLAAAAVGAIVLWLSDWLQPPSSVAFEGHGEYFQAMTVDPLWLHGAFPHRILWPLLAHFTGLGGPRAPVFSQVCNGAFLATVFWFCRQRGAKAADALLVTAAVAATGAVLVYKPMACYSDTLMFLLLLLAVHFVARPAVFWGLVLLASLAHEMVFFFAPWLVYLRCQAGGRQRREVLALGGVGAVYAAWRLVVRVGATGVAYDSLYYMKNNFWVPWGMPALWALWAFVLLVEFGPLLAIVVWAWRRGELGMGRWGPWLYVAGILPLMLLAYDVMRFAALAFLPLVLGSVAFLCRPRGRSVLAVLLVSSIASYAWLHPVPSQQGGAEFTRISGEILSLLPGRVEKDQPMSFSNAASFTYELVLRTWPTVLASCVALALVVAAGLWLARSVPSVQVPAGQEPRTSRNASP